GEGGEEDEQEHHGTCLLLAASASCSQAMALTWRWRSAKYSHRRVISAAWIMRASSSSRSGREMGMEIGAAGAWPDCRARATRTPAQAAAPPRRARAKRMRFIPHLLPRRRFP